MAQRQLKGRVFCSSDDRMNAAPSTSPPSNSRPSKYKAWDDTNMGRALSAVTMEGMTIRQASLHYGVPKSTLGDRVSGRVLTGATSGPETYLDEEEEKELVQFLLRCSEIGYAKSRKQVLSLVKRLLQTKGRDVPVTSGWWQTFCTRHPNLTLRAPAPLSKARAVASDPTMLSRYFDLLEEVLTENNLLGNPCQIFNMDESGMPLDPPHVKCVTNRGERNPIAPSSGDKTQITVVACVNAAGSCIPPMVILDRKTLPPRFTEGEVPGTTYGLSTKGWIDQELFNNWFIKHFLRHAPLARPLLLLLDGHSSHYCPETVRLAAKEKVVMFALPPNTTHLTQPLDKGCFGPLKSFWKEECHNFMTSNPGVVVNRYSFSKLFSKAWMKAMSMKNIRAGFEVCGIFPFSRDALSIPLHGQQKMETLASKSGLAYIPLFTPAKRRDSRSSSCRRSRTRRRRHHSSSCHYRCSSSCQYCHSSSSCRTRPSSDDQQRHPSSCQHPLSPNYQRHCSSTYRYRCSSHQSSYSSSEQSLSGQYDGNKDCFSSLKRRSSSHPCHTLSHRQQSSTRPGHSSSHKHHSTCHRRHRSLCRRHHSPGVSSSRSSSSFSHRHCSSYGRSGMSPPHLHRRSSSYPRLHSHAHSSPRVKLLQSHSGSLLSVLSPPERREEVRPTKPCGRVLTSMENLKAIEEKERVKKEKVRKKEEHKQIIEQRKQEKAKLAREKRQKIEARKIERRSALEAKRCTVGRRKLEKDCQKGHVQQSDQKQLLTFTGDEIKRFEVRFENGYDLMNDERYNAWLTMKCSGNDGSAHCASFVEPAEEENRAKEQRKQKEAKQTKGRRRSVEARMFEKSRAVATKRCFIGQKTLEKDKQKGKEQPQDYSPIDSPSFSMVHCPSALELSSPGDSFHLLKDLDEPCTSLVELFSENESLHHTGDSDSSRLDTVCLSESSGKFTVHNRKGQAGAGDKSSCVTEPKKMRKTSETQASAGDKSSRVTEPKKMRKTQASAGDKSSRVTEPKKMRKTQASAGDKFSRVTEPKRMRKTQARAGDKSSCATEPKKVGKTSQIQAGACDQSSRATEPIKTKKPSESQGSGQSIQTGRRLESASREEATCRRGGLKCSRSVEPVKWSLRSRREKL